MTELRKELTVLFSGLRDGEIDVKTASEMNNCAGKIINTTKAQLEYYNLSGEKPKIPFLE